MDHSEVKHLKVDHMPAKLDEASRLLMMAASLIEARGHWRGGKPNGGTCAILAIQECQKWCDGDYSEAINRLAGSLGAFGHGRLGRVYDWNDSHTTDEVVAKLRSVALGL